MVAQQSSGGKCVCAVCLHVWGRGSRVVAEEQGARVEEPNRAEEEEEEAGKSQVCWR